MEVAPPALLQAGPCVVTTLGQGPPGRLPVVGSMSRAVTMRLPGAYSPRVGPDRHRDRATGSGGWAEPVSFRYQVRTAWTRAAR